MAPSIRTGSWGEKGRSARAGTRLAALLLGASTALACALPSRPAVVGTPRGFRGFPTESTDTAIWAEAVLPVERGPVLVDELAGHRVLPVLLRVGLVSDSNLDALRIDPETFNPRLYLSDGTVLPWISPEKAVRDSKLRSLAAKKGFAMTLLAPWEETRRGLVFFDLGRVRARDHFALVRHGDVFRELDLYHSLLGFRAEGRDGPHEVRVGIASEYVKGGAR
ncbi:MAG TPA: hypothetical protein ENJ09_10365 [Planctomycetes bacterium]|nr:hypothetical protein [Planctomycetota bacterium]